MNAIKVKCPGCALKVQVVRTPMQGRCRRCQAVLLIAADGAVTLGLMIAKATRPVLRRQAPLDQAIATAKGWLCRWEIYAAGVAVVAVLSGLTFLVVWLGSRGATTRDEWIAVESLPAAPKVQPKPMMLAFYKPAPEEPMAKHKPSAPASEPQKPPQPASEPQKLQQPAPEPVSAATGVDRAKERGIAYLKSALTDGNAGQRFSQVGAKALAGHTLLQCGVPANDPAIQKALTAIRNGAPNLTQTYDLAICVWFLDKLDRAEDKPLLKTLSMRLIAGQGERGGWGYTSPILSISQEAELIALLQATKPKTQASPAKARASSAKTPKIKSKNAPAMSIVPPIRGAPVRLTGNLADLPVLRQRTGQDLADTIQQHHEDNSLAQFAVLALWLAHRHDVPVRQSLALAEARFQQNQAPDGSWGYTWEAKIRRDSMTCAGLLALAVGNGNRRLHSDKSAAGRSIKDDPAVQRAFRFVAKKIGAPAQPAMAPEDLAKMQAKLRDAKGPEREELLRQWNNVAGRGKLIGAEGWGDLYFLWSLERVAMVYDLAMIEGKDWYAWGSPLIVAAQQADGSWADRFPGVPDTCFALLFLQRYHVSQNLTRIILMAPIADEQQPRR